MRSARLAVDIGGTFTDLALEAAGKRTTVKVLTTQAAPERGVMEGFRTIIRGRGRRTERHRTDHSWDHVGDQRDNRTQGRPHRADHDGGLS